MNIKNDHLHLGSSISAIRRAKSMKQSTLAQLMESTQQAVSKMESRPFIGGRLLQRVAKALNVSISDIVEFDQSSVLEGVNPRPNAQLMNKMASLIIEKIGNLPEKGH